MARDANLPPELLEPVKPVDYASLKKKIARDRTWTNNPPKQVGR